MFAVIDIETTGGRPERDRITEIAILLHDGEKVVDRFEDVANEIDSLRWGAGYRGETDVEWLDFRHRDHRDLNGRAHRARRRGIPLAPALGGPVGQHLLESRLPL